MNLEGTMLSEISQTQRHKDCIVHVHEKSNKTVTR